MLETVIPSNGTILETILLIPVKYILEIGIPILFGILLIILFCCICNCIFCFCFGKKTKKKEKTPIRKPRSERDGTIYSEINPAGMIENQRKNSRIQPENNNIIINQMNLNTEFQIEITNCRNKFQKSVSTESAYQEMDAQNCKSSCKLESIGEAGLSDEENISIV